MRTTRAAPAGTNGRCASVADRRFIIEHHSRAVTASSPSANPYDGVEFLVLRARCRPQAFQWQRFTATLNTAHLHAYLGRLPDFDDIEAEQRAMGSGARLRRRGPVAEIPHHLARSGGEPASWSWADAGVERPIEERCKVLRNLHYY
ncbi:DUF6880 family protein [Roseomonas gilardii]|uniref:DUF6880 family protein n=1 Tax=Roseomonas gilardii TaxID=257708 RepID=UPI0038CF2E7D